MIREIGYYSGMMLGVYRLLRHAPVADPLQALCEQMAARESRFLALARSVVFGNPGNPYHEMFRAAGCGFGDLAGSVAQNGLEATLERLLAAGVYLTHDEFKGKTPIVRAGKEIPATAASFLNPLVSGHFETRSSGSRSPGTPARQSTELKLYRTAYTWLETRVLGLDGRARAQLYPVLPSSIGLSQGLALGRTGQRVEKWFSPRGSLQESGHYRATTHLLVQFARALGAPLPLPEYLPDNNFVPVAQWLAREKQRGRNCSVASFVSPALRVTTAARQANLDISGTVFVVGGEALTDAKRAGIEAAGCEVYPRYIINEVGRIGCACRQMRSGNSVHLFRDGVAVVSRRRRAPLAEVEVNSLLFTTLLPFATRLLINAEMDDAGIVEPATCGCEYSALGMNVRIRDILSYGKLTGQGVTLMGSDALEVLEVALPARFGGCAGDYQLVEDDGPHQTELTLRVSPRVGAVSATDVRAFFLAEIRHYYGGSLAARLWKHAEGFHVAIQEPCATVTGKVLPLHLLRSKRKDTNAA
jgi:hypothetical protein